MYQRHMMGLQNQTNQPEMPNNSQSAKNSNHPANVPSIMSNIITSQQLFAHEQKLLQQAGSMNLKKAYTQPNGIGSLPQG